MKVTQKGEKGAPEACSTTVSLPQVSVRRPTFFQSFLHSNNHSWAQLRSEVLLATVERPGSRKEKTHHMMLSGVRPERRPAGSAVQKQLSLKPPKSATLKSCPSRLCWAQNNHAIGMTAKESTRIISVTGKSRH